MDVLSEKTEDGGAEVMWLSCVTKQTNSSPATGGSPSSRMEPALLWISSSFIGGSRLLTKALLPIGRMSLKVHNPPPRESKIEKPLALRWNYLLDNDPRAWLQTDRAQIGKKRKNITKKRGKSRSRNKMCPGNLFWWSYPWLEWRQWLLKWVFTLSLRTLISSSAYSWRENGFNTSCGSRLLLRHRVSAPLDGCPSGCRGDNDIIDRPHLDACTSFLLRCLRYWRVQQVALLCGALHITGVSANYQYHTTQEFF